MNEGTSWPQRRRRGNEKEADPSHHRAGLGRRGGWQNEEYEADAISAADLVCQGPTRKVEEKANGHVVM